MNAPNFKKWSRLAIVALAALVCAGCAAGGKKPFADLKASDVASFEIRLMPPDARQSFDDSETIEKLVSILNTAEIYNRDDSYTEYAGQLCLYTLTLKSGETRTVQAYSPFMIIDDVGYKTLYEPCEALNQLGNNLLRTRFAEEDSNGQTDSQVTELPDLRAYRANGDAYLFQRFSDASGEAADDAPAPWQADWGQNSTIAAFGGEEFTIECAAPFEIVSQTIHAKSGEILVNATRAPDAPNDAQNTYSLFAPPEPGVYYDVLEARFADSRVTYAVKITVDPYGATVIRGEGLAAFAGVWYLDGDAENGRSIELFADGTFISRYPSGDGDFGGAFWAETGYGDVDGMGRPLNGTEIMLDDSYMVMAFTLAGGDTLFFEPDGAAFIRP